MAKVVQLALEQCFVNHIYQADNTLFRQVSGGGIGARVTGVAARVLMDVWADLLSTILDQNEVVIHMLATYVDDVNLATSTIPRGYSWHRVEDEWKLVWTEESQLEDEGNKTSDADRTMELVREVGDKLVPGLKLTKDLPEYHPNGKCPMLDIQVWLEERQGFCKIRHTFYQKPQPHPWCFMPQGHIHGGKNYYLS